MIQTITAFAALSMAGTILLSLIPEGGIRRTAAMTIGLLTLVCWAEGIAGLLGLDIDVHLPPTPLVNTAISLPQTESAVADALLARWEAVP